MPDARNLGNGLAPVGDGWIREPKRDEIAALLVFDAGLELSTERARAVADIICAHLRQRG